MIHVVDFEKTAFSTSFRGVLPPSGPQISAEGGMGYPLLGARETWVVSTVHRPLFSRPTPHASRLSSGVRSCAGPSPLATDTNRRFVKERTGPDRDEQPLCIEYDTEPDDPFGQIKIFLPARRSSTVDRSLAAGGAQRQWVQACLPVGSGSESVSALCCQARTGRPHGRISLTRGTASWFQWVL